MLPKSIQLKVTDIQHDIQQKSLHRVSTRQRAELYDVIFTIPEMSDSDKQKVIGHIALVSARRVLPIYEEFVSNTNFSEYFQPEIKARYITHDLARSFVDAAEKFIQGKLNEEQYRQIWEDGEIIHTHTASFLPDAVSFALKSCVLVLDEVRRPPFSGAKNTSDNQVTDKDSPAQLAHFNLSDVRLARGGDGDVAITSAVAASSGMTDRQKRYLFLKKLWLPEVREAIETNTIPNNEPVETDENKMREFWLWWLDYAIPEGWKNANID